MKAALYVRVSTQHQKDKDSLPFQKKELKNYAKYVLGIEKFEIFEDAGYSGKNTDRPKFQEMMSRIRKDEFSHLLVWKIDRISRNLKDFTEMYEELKRNGIIFISKNEQFDTSTAMGEAMLKIILVFAELERKLTAERVFSIMLSRAEKGLWNGARVPLGYDFDEDLKFPTINEAEAAVVRFIYNSYEDTKSTNDVKHLLEENCISTKNQKSWTTKTIADILRNPFYKGTYRYNYRESARGKIKPEAEWIIVEDNHTPIISKEQFEKVNAILDSNIHGRGSDRTRNSNTHVFKGLVFCSKCKKNYISATDRARSDSYRPSVYRCFNYVHNKKDYRTCHGSIGEIKLGPFVINYIANLIKAKEYIETARIKSSEKEMEKILLKGTLFKDIAGILPLDLKKTFNALARNDAYLMFETDDNSPSLKKEKEVSPDLELGILNTEKEKIERAIQRLEDLYLFSDDSMSEKNYLLKKRELEGKLKTILVKLKNKNKDQKNLIPEYNLDFIKKSSQYLIGENLLKDTAIDYNSIVKMIDKKLMQSFMQSVVKQIVINEDKKIESIEFINGMIHRFVYK